MAHLKSSCLLQMVLESSSDRRCYVVRLLMKRKHLAISTPKTRFFLLDSPNTLMDSTLKDLFCSHKIPFCWNTWDKISITAFKRSQQTKVVCNTFQHIMASVSLPAMMMWPFSRSVNHTQTSYTDAHPRTCCV